MITLRKLRQYGVRRIVQKAKMKVLYELGIKSSKTIFLKYETKNGTLSEVKKVDLRFISSTEDIVEISKINIYEFLNVNEMIINPNIKICIATLNNEVVGLCFFHKSECHNIHGLGSWNLKENEAWVGPAFVSKKVRNQGINGAMLDFIKSYSFKSKIDNLYTSINSGNHSSLRSFDKNEFKQIGYIEKNKLKKISLHFTRDFYKSKFNDK